jgi:membrane associated rhomboid family serine protease
VIPLKDDLPVDRPPVLTVALIAANVAAFLWQLQVGLEQSVLRGGAIPGEILSFTDIGPRDIVPPPFTIFTSMFLHGGFAHIAGNMLFLWIFGNHVEDALGKVRFLFFYLACGAVAALAQTVTTAAAGDVLIPMVGASGAIAGVLAAYLTLFPRARVLTLIPIFFFIRFVYIPAYIFISLWFAIQLLSALAGPSGTGVAFVAHVGGFLCGLVLVRLVGRRRVSYRRRSSW